MASEEHQPEEVRRRGDPRITREGREILTRIVMGDLADEFADSLAETCDNDPLLGGGRGGP